MPEYIPKSRMFEEMAQKAIELRYSQPHPTASLFSALGKIGGSYFGAKAEADKETRKATRDKEMMEQKITLEEGSTAFQSRESDIRKSKADLIQAWSAGLMQLKKSPTGKLDEKGKPEMKELSIGEDFYDNPLKYLEKSAISRYGKDAKGGYTGRYAQPIGPTSAVFHKQDLKAQFVDLDPNDPDVQEALKAIDLITGNTTIGQIEEIKDFGWNKQQEQVKKAQAAVTLTAPISTNIKMMLETAREKSPIYKGGAKPTGTIKIKKGQKVKQKSTGKTFVADADGDVDSKDYEIVK